ncbi:hypothetical protein BGZ60DRAFT_378407 [Tricladium varicosporioides]|nr:hypothetical protein BGZ60DRAFT_378407 [Hymenoscyphus varicosporioides]
MAGTGGSSPFIKDEPEDQFFSSNRFMGGNQGFNGSHNFNQFSSNGGSINPSDLTMGGGVNIPNGGFGGSNQYFSAQAQNTSGSYPKAIATFADDELLDTLSPINDQHSNQNGMQSNGQDYDIELNYGMYPNHNGGTPAMSLDTNHINGYTNTPDGDPIQSPFAYNFAQPPFRHIQQGNTFSNSPSGSYGGSPIPGSADAARQRSRAAAQGVVRRPSNTRSPMTPKAASVGIGGLHIGSAEGSSFTAPIRTAHRHQKSLSGQYEHPSSLGSYPDSHFGSPLQGVHPNPAISDILKGTSMPTKLGHQAGSAPALQSQEMKRRRRRESHNLVERRRRDNINERIQELSHLVPLHRLEDEKVRKALQNNSPLSPTLTGISQPGSSGMSPPQATSGLAGPGARRATGNITTGIPIEEKDKGPNKGDILNGAVSWTRDLMWMLHTKLQQQEELANTLAENGIAWPFHETEDERRMHTELMDAMVKNEGSKFQYSRAPGSGLHVPKHTDIKGNSVGGSATGQDDNSLSPENPSTGGDAGQAGMGGAGQYWSGHNSGGSGPGSISFKEEDEYGMDMTQ